MSWKAPKDDGGEKINNYIVEKRKKGAGKWGKVSGLAKEPTVQVRNLEPGTEYEFRVMAENNQGVSEPLETEKAILAKLPYGQLFLFYYSMKLIKVLIFFFGGEGHYSFFIT